MYISVDASLKKLRTSYIDILYVHFWDFDTSVEEVMNGLHTLVQQGKVLYLVRSKYQWFHSLLILAPRVFQIPLHGSCQSVISMLVITEKLRSSSIRAHGMSCHAILNETSSRWHAWKVCSLDESSPRIYSTTYTGMALAPWNVLAAGRLRTDAEEERRRQTGEKGRIYFTPDWERTPLEREMSLALEKVAKEVGTPHITAVAIAYLMHKAPYVFPIIGGRKVEYLEANVDALRITLTPEHIKFLESIVPFDAGFPNTIIVSAHLLLVLSYRHLDCQGDGTDYMVLIKAAAYIEKQPGLRPIKPSL